MRWLLIAWMLSPWRFSPSISCTSFPRSTCRTSPWRFRCGYTPLAKGWGILFRYYGDFCTGADTSGLDPSDP